MRLANCEFGEKGGGGLDVVVVEVDGELVDCFGQLKRFVVGVAFFVLRSGKSMLIVVRH